MDPTVHFDVVKSELTRQVFNVTPEVCDELCAAVDEIWGTDTQALKEVTLFESITKIIARTSNRVFVGLPFCRDEAYIHNAVGFAEDIALSATLLRLFPGTIRPLVAPIITYPNRRHARAYTKILTPEIVRRQDLQRGKETDIVAVSDVEKTTTTPLSQTGGQVADRAAAQKNDFLQWLLTRSLTKSTSKRKAHSASLSPDETDPAIICARLLHTNFAAVHTTSFIGTNVILDILSAPLDEGVVDKLRAEAIQTMDTESTSNPNVKDPSNVTKMWSRSSLTKMHYLDSALRESSRRASIIGVGINHKVISPGGVTTPDGTHLPEGSMVAVHSWGLHNDENLYSRAGTYKPFRFVELKENIGRRSGEEDAGEGGNGSERKSNDCIKNTKTVNTDHEEDQVAEREKEKDAARVYLDQAHLQFIATSPTYLGFGHGRHACPGRFFAANELKLLIAYLVMRYDIQMVTEGKDVGREGSDDWIGNANGRGVRPECYWAGPNHVPPMGAKVRVRRRVI
ncbi:hypothetical protein A1O1_02284 [Capronia coronata CBS 617.96]|uniref:Cytochrome P450 n=1 Tax=Capronia coronata CBS 617.96 TaxID=1182541 RepID=W9YXB1_9EURO|nr:uncharacterized protein A1O1_02284 [Capronia coronata CBS 617.96]EXJ93891.1 hypothetical protein A1O1_02284 [Capronia coronata CBS 617.96]